MTDDLNPELYRVCYPGNNASCVSHRLSFVEDFVLYLVLVFVMLVTVLGNFVVIVSVCHFKLLYKPTNVLIASLALADLLVGVIVIPFFGLRLVNNCWYFGDIFCKLYMAFELLFTTVSIIHLMCIAVDRYQAICYPLHYSRLMTMSVAVITVCVSWTLAAVYAFGITLSKIQEIGLVTWDAHAEPCLGSCFLYYGPYWGLFSSILTFFFPCIVTVSLYIKIFIVAKKHVKKIGDKKNCSNDRGKGQSVKQSEHKAAKTLSIVLGAFIFCWLPFYIDFYLQSTPVFSVILMWLSYFNSALNPIIYALFHPSFKKCFHCIITLKIFSPNSSTMNLSVK